MKDIKYIIDIVTNTIDTHRKGEDINVKLKSYGDEFQDDIKLIFFVLKNNKKTVNSNSDWNYDVITRDFIKYNREKQLNKICQ